MQHAHAIGGHVEHSRRDRPLRARLAGREFRPESEVRNDPVSSEADLSGKTTARSTIHVWRDNRGLAAVHTMIHADPGDKICHFHSSL
jgi:hypothetical protein